MSARPALQLLPTAPVMGLPPGELETAILNRWLTECAKSPHSVRSYQRALRRFLSASNAASIYHACRTPIVARQNIANFHADLSVLSRGTQTQEISAIRSLLVLAEKLGLIDHPVSPWLKLTVASARCARCRGKGEYGGHTCPDCYGYGELPEDGMVALTQVPDHATCMRVIHLEPDTEKRFILTTLYRTGLRSAELLGLRKSRRFDAEDAEGNPLLCFRVLGKGRKVQPVVMGGEMRVKMDAWLRSFAPAGDNVFSVTSDRTLRYICETAWKRGGVDASTHPNVPNGFGTHLWRACLATNLLRAGAPRDDIRVTLRHAKLETTEQHYIHSLPAPLDKYLPW